MGDRGTVASMSIRNSRVGVILSPMSKNMVKIKVVQVSDLLKGDYARVPVKIWYQMGWSPHGDELEEAIQLLRDGILKWRSRNFTR